MARNVEVFPTPEALAIAAADAFVDAANASIADRAEFILALSGGSTPRALYALLGSPSYRSRVNWGAVEFLWSDERCVPPDDANSNYRMAHETLLGPARVAVNNIHRVQGEHGALIAADEYDETLRDLLGASDGTAPGDEPDVRIDLVLLGLGDDGHTASLIPGVLPPDSGRWAAAVEKTPIPRVTLTARAINAAAEIVFLVSGAGKAAIVAKVLEGPSRPQEFPAQMIAPATGRVRWLLDAAAASALASARQ